MQPIAPYKYKTSVRFSDTDANGHVNNGKYFDYFEEARTTWAYERSDLMKWAKENSLQFVTVEQSCKYIRPLLHPAHIEVTQHIVKYGAATIEFEASIRLCDSNKLMATAKIKLACFNPRTNRPKRLPTHIKQIIM